MLLPVSISVVVYAPVISFPVVVLVEVEVLVDVLEFEAAPSLSVEDGGTVLLPLEVSV